MSELLIGLAFAAALSFVLLNLNQKQRLITAGAALILAIAMLAVCRDNLIAEFVALVGLVVATASSICGLVMSFVGKFGAQVKRG